MSENFEYQFDENGNGELDTQFIKNMGILGASLARSVQAGVEKELEYSERQNRGGNSLVVRDDFSRSSRRDTGRNSGGSLIDDSAIELLRTTTYDVRIANSMRDLVDPMYERLSELHDEAQTLNILIATDQLRMLKKINLTLLDQGDVTDDWVGSMTTFYRRLVDHPGLTAMTLLGKGIGKTFSTVAGIGKSILFGKGDQRSNTEKIVQAIDKVREFMMTNAVDERKSLWERYKTGGLTGFALSGAKNLAGKAVGASRGLAEQREDRRSRGRFVKNNISGKISDIFYSNRMVKKNKNPNDLAMSMLIKRQTNDLTAWKDFRKQVLAHLGNIPKTFENIKDVNGSATFEDGSISRSARAERPLQQPELVGLVDGTLVGLDHIAMDALSKSIANGNRQFKLIEDMREIAELQYTETQTNLAVAEENQKATMVMTGLSKETVKKLGSLFDMQDEILDETKQGNGYQKKTFKETAKARRAAQLRAMIGLVLGGIKTVVGAVVTAGAVISGAIATAIGGSLIKRIFSGNKNPKGAVTPSGATAATNKVNSSNKGLKPVPATNLVEASKKPSMAGKAGRLLSKAALPVAAGYSYYSKGKELEGRTDLSNQAKTAQQASTTGGFLVGAAGGAAIGAKIGASVGMFLGPLGAAIAGAVGAGIGGIAGGVYGERLGETVGESISPAINNLVGHVDAAKEELSTFDKLKNKGKSIIDDREKTFEKLKEKTSNARDTLKTATMGAINGSKNVGANIKEKVSEIDPAAAFNDFTKHLETVMQRSNEQMKVTTEEFIGMTRNQTDAISKAMKEAIAGDKSSDKVVDSIESMTDKLSRVFSDGFRAQQSAPQQAAPQFSASPNGTDMMNVMGR